MEEPVSPDSAQIQAELMLLQGLAQSVTAKTDGVRHDLAAIRGHRQAVANLAEAVTIQVRPLNRVHADAAQLRTQALALLALPSLALLDY